MTSDDDQMDSVEMDGRGRLSDQSPVTDPAENPSAPARLLATEHRYAGPANRAPTETQQ